MMTSLVVGLTLVLGAPVPKGKEKPKEVVIEGEWRVVAIDGGPKELPPGGLIMRFEKDKVAIIEAGKEKPEMADYTLNREKTPYEIDIKPNPGQVPANVKIDIPTIKGILEITEDTMKLCFSRPDKGGRPTEFKGTPDVIFFTLKRETPQKK
ncbi:MAG: TIGR03067 domain-containing protein [Zavarzinella sp.]